MKRKQSLAEHRRHQVLDEVKRTGVARTSDLAREHGVSLMTIRNDLTALASQGQLVRVHGGAVTQQCLTEEPSYSDKVARNQDEKRAIGREAAQLIEDGMAVFIGNGSTTMEIIRHLPNACRLHAFTNSLNHAEAMAPLSNSDVYVIGGHLRGVSLAMVGRLSHQALQGIYFDMAFLGVNGVSPTHGLTIPSLEESEIAAEIFRHCQRAVVVADHTKFGIITHGKIASVADVDVIITDDGLGPAFRQSMADSGVEIRLATTKGR